jgi:hypothetical protein
MSQCFIGFSNSNNIYTTELLALLLIHLLGLQSLNLPSFMYNLIQANKNALQQQFLKIGTST